MEKERIQEEHEYLLNSCLTTVIFNLILCEMGGAQNGSERGC